jgi:hypothetical protein
MKTSRTFLLFLLPALPVLAATPVRLHPLNPHYFLYDGKPAVLIGSGEHYSAVLNLGFDYTKYLQELRRNGLNLTRTFSGAYREAAVDPHGATPLSPGRGPDHFISPWALSDVKGGYDGRKYDLDRWNPAYFDRLKSFCRRARENGVVVELVLFCRMYTDANHWKISPLHPDNNLQGEAWREVGNQRFMTLDSPALVERQRAVTRKIVTELQDIPNVYFEVANEPASGPHDSAFAREVHSWHEAIIDEIVSAEASLPQASRHLIAYNDHYDAGRGIGAIPRAAAVSILNVHYLPKLVEALAEYRQNKALAIDETRWIGHPRLGQYGNTMTPASGRVEAWEFLLGGGAVYSNLNFAYNVGRETGTSPESDESKGYLRKLKEFVTAFDFVRMRPDTSLITGGLPPGAIARALGEAGNQYGIYIHYSAPARGMNRYEVSDQARTVDLTLELPAGNYRVEWVRPTDLTVLRRQDISAHRGSKVALATSPEHRMDVAIRIVKR